jgi:hypothetical protein
MTVIAMHAPNHLSSPYLERAHVRAHPWPPSQALLVVGRWQGPAHEGHVSATTCRRLSIVLFLCPTPASGEEGALGGTAHARAVEGSRKERQSWGPPPPPLLLEGGCGCHRCHRGAPMMRPH